MEPHTTGDIKAAKIEGLTVAENTTKIQPPVSETSKTNEPANDWDYELEMYMHYFEEKHKRAQNSAKAKCAKVIKLVSDEYESDDGIHQKPCPDSGAHTSPSKHKESFLSVIHGEKSNAGIQKHNHDVGVLVSESNRERILPKRLPNTSEENPSPDASDPESQSDQENSVVALRPVKGLDKLPPRRNPDNAAVHISFSNQGDTFSTLPEKPTVDGFNWRKYGQKLVRGNSFVRSYYKCTYVNCPAIKQVERPHDGHITEINYLGKHEHPKPAHPLLESSSGVQENQTSGSNEPSLTSETSWDPESSETRPLSMVASSEDNLNAAVPQSTKIESEVNKIPPDPKRQKKKCASINNGVVTKTNYEPRLVVETTSAVNNVNDGYRWRKYGQKLVKGNPNPRSYYRCSNVVCPAKKHVERASYDEKVVITTYEGRHDHDMPFGIRTITQNTLGR